MGRTARIGEEDGVTRRSFLVASGVVAATALGGTIAARELPLRQLWDRWTGACGTPGPIPPSSDSTVRTGTFASAVLGSDVGYALAVPPGRAIGDPLPVTFLLPGRGGTAEGCMTGTHFPDFLARGIAERGVPPFGLASVDGGASYWHRRASGEDRMSMLMDEFVPLCAARWNLGSSGRAILGWSMGGYGAILAAEQHPSMFEAVAAVAPAIFKDFADGDDAFDSDADFARNDVVSNASRLAGLPVRIDCGTADPFCPDVRMFVAALPSPPAGRFFTGCHNSGSWRVVAPAQVDFLGAAFHA